MEPKTSWKTLKNVSNPNYIGEADFENNEEKIVTIAKVVTDETVKATDGTSKQKTVLYFAENVKPMILNVAKAKSISKATKSKFLEDWVGKKITLYIDDHVRAFGEIVSAVRVRDKAPVVREISCEVCHKAIAPAFGMNAEELARYTKSKYSITVCADCAKVLAEKKKEMEAQKEAENNEENISSDAE